MKKIISIFCVVLLSTIFRAQESLPYYQQYLFDGGFLFNPALYGNTDNVVINLNYQKQYSKLSESPNVQSVGIHANVYDRVGVGASFFRDQSGPISANGITAGASYTIPLNDDGERKNQFSFGTSANFYNMTFDYGLLHPEQSGDPLLAGDNSIFLAYANFGLAATYKDIFGNLSVNDIALTNDEPIVNGIEPSPIKIFLNLGYDWYFGENMYVTPSILINLNTNSSRMTDYNLTGTVTGETSSFSAGASFRTVQNKYGTQNLSISPLIKAKVGKYNFGATYNIGMSGIQPYGGNSFMVSIGLNLNNFINTRGFRY